MSLAMKPFHRCSMQLGLLIYLTAPLTGQFAVQQLRDPVANRAVTRYQSPNHETHHYYFISPWSPDEKLVTFFQFEQNVEKLISLF